MMVMLSDRVEPNDGPSTDPWTEAFRAGLRQRLADREGELQRLQMERRRLDADIAEVQQHLDALRVLARQEGLTAPEPSLVPAVAPAGGGSLRRGSRVPARRPEFASSTLLEAA